MQSDPEICKERGKCMTILDELANHARHRVRQSCMEKPLSELMTQAAEMETKNAFNFEKALGTKELSFICEVKRASPSKGLIAAKFPYLEIAQEYEQAGAGAVSVLTEPKFFRGKDQYLSEIAGQIDIPVLRKDFIVDPYQIYEAKLLGADAVLLICSLLSADQLRKYINICDQLGLSALVEAHSEAEVAMALRAGTRVLGVNNRNLKNFEVDMMNCIRLREFVPREVLFVAESGIHTPVDIRLLQTAGVDAVLIGEALMRSQDKKKELQWLRGFL